MSISLLDPTYQNTAPRGGVLRICTKNYLVFADLADSKEPVAWILGYLVTCWQPPWPALPASDFREEVNSLVLATTKCDILLLQEVLNPF